MERAVHELDRARGRMAGDFRNLISDSEDLLKAAVSVSGEGFATARAQFEDRLRSANAALAEASQPVLDRTRETIAVADRYVRGNAWTVVGVAIAAGVLIGLLSATRKAADARRV